MKLKIMLLAIIFGLALFLRLYQLNSVPSGLQADEASIGYDAYSILKTGQDQYGKPYPLFFRSFATYQSPLYIYLTVVSIYFFGLSFLSIKLASVICGIILLFTTFLIIYLTVDKQKFSIATLSILVLAISPWSIMFSRYALEANLGLTILSLGLLFFLLSFKKAPFLILSAITLAISTYAYPAERVISVGLIFCLLILFRKIFLNKKLIVIISIAIFSLILVPQLLILFTPGSTRRLDQLSYWSDSYYNQLDHRNPTLVEKSLAVSSEFISHYLAYLSPRSLFFDPDPQLARSIPDLSVFYLWMIIPFFCGLKNLINNRHLPLNKILILLMLFTPFPAALTKDPFYTIRVIPLLWAFTIVISVGCFNMLSRFSFPVRTWLVIGITLFALFQFYIHYFIYLKYERSDDYGFSYIKLAQELKKYPSYNILIDNRRYGLLYIWFPLIWQTDPRVLQNQTDFDVSSDYYTNVFFDGKRRIDKVEFAPLDWIYDNHDNQILVGDNLAIDEIQVKAHQLELLFQIKNMAGQVTLSGYKTHPFKKN